jgi:protein TonB
LPKAGYDYQKFLASNLRYPNSVIENDIQGKVVVKFVINEDGTISDIAVIKSVDPALDAEAIRIVSKFPKWQPGMYDDKPVKVSFTLPIVFNLK